MDLLKRYQQFIKENDLFSAKDKLIIAVSGGIDSVVLCELCKQAGYDFTIAHCNFQLRGEESERDERFVRSLGEKYKVEVTVKKFETERFAEENKMSIQEAARELRYKWFAELASGRWVVGYDEKQIKKYMRQPRTMTHVLTAHHADDNAETVLMNFCRGTGLWGLAGIRASYLFVTRPLLNFTKAEIVQFAKENGLEYVEDSSNSSSKYTRNFFRNEIIPAISKVYPQVKANLTANAARFFHIAMLYSNSVNEICKKLIKEKGNEWHIPIKQLIQYGNKALIYEIIRVFDFTEKQIDEVIKLAESESGKYIDSPNANYRIIKHRHWFIVSTIYPGGVADIIVIEESDKKIDFQQAPGHGVGKIEIEKLTSNLKPLQRSPSGQTSNNIACLDAKEITYPLILRKWKQGDYFYPLGMKKKKKLSRFLIDQKLSKTEKEKTWVIEMNKKIIWVVGKRIDERFKVTEKTKNVFKISYILPNVMILLGSIFFI